MAETPAESTTVTPAAAEPADGSVAEPAAEPAAVAAPTQLEKLAAEAVGTFVLVFFGCGTVVYSGAVDGFGQVTTFTTVGLAFGLALTVMVYAFGRVSGAHFNPAVSVAAAVGGRMPWRQVGLYVVAQLVGAVLAALVLFVLMHGYDGFDATDNMGQNFFGDHNGASGYAWWAAFLLELLLTAVFVTVILAVTDERNEHPSLAPLTIGLTLAVIHFVALPATGTSVNPARSIGPALFAGADAIQQLWLFILAPLIGGAVAGFAYPAVFGRGSEAVPGSGFAFPRPRAAVVVGPDQYQQQWNQEAGWSGQQGQGYQQTYQQGYQQPYQQGYEQPYEQTQTHAAVQQEPIIQNGWQWDPIGQQWHPVGQTPEQWRAQQAQQQAQQQAEQQAAERAAQQAAERERAADPLQQRWPESEPGDGGTHIRPPQ